MIKGFLLKNEGLTSRSALVAEIEPFNPKPQKCGHLSISVQRKVRIYISEQYPWLKPRASGY